LSPASDESRRVDPFAGLGIDAWIASRATDLGFHLDPVGVTALAAHAGRVLAHNDRLHLTSIVEPTAFIERHLGESLEGAAMIPAGTDGRLLDLGSGNGYPGLPVAVARPLLEPVLAEASQKKACFLRELINDCLGRGCVLERQIQRAGDLEELQPIQVVVTRAVGNWGRILPRLVPALGPDAMMLIWAGDSVETMLRRSAWSRLELAEKRPIRDRERSWIWKLACRNMTR
jgi:16S rRNA (guanine527-N7)-methyltransferase